MNDNSIDEMSNETSNTLPLYSFSLFIMKCRSVKNKKYLPGKEELFTLKFQKKIQRQ